MNISPKLNQRILTEFMRMLEEGLAPSKILRELIKGFDLVSPPQQADYFATIYGISASEFIPALGARLDSRDPEVVDQSFDQRIADVLEKNPNN